MMPRDASCFRRLSIADCAGENSANIPLLGLPLEMLVLLCPCPLMPRCIAGGEFNFMPVSCVCMGEISVPERVPSQHHRITITAPHTITTANSSSRSRTLRCCDVLPLVRCEHGCDGFAFGRIFGGLQ